MQVEKVVSELKGEKSKVLGKQVLTNLRNRIVPNTAPGVARGAMMVNTK